MWTSVQQEVAERNFDPDDGDAMAEAYVKADVRRVQLVGAARAVLEREGMAGATLRAVAAEAGVPLGTVHYIFASKEQLLRAVLEDVIDEIADAARASAGDATDFPSAMRRTALEVWSRLVEGHAEHQLMQYELTLWALRTPGMADLARRQYGLYVEVLTAIWSEAAARAGFTPAIPADQLARLHLAGVDGLILQYLTLGDAERARADLAALVGQLVRYGAPESGAAA
jgi:TetR/AcrR family transcriptional regulator, regulator of biofilm formation and stress response